MVYCINHKFRGAYMLHGIEKYTSASIKPLVRERSSFIGTCVYWDTWKELFAAANLYYSNSEITERTFPFEGPVGELSNFRVWAIPVLEVPGWETNGVEVLFKYRRDVHFATSVSFGHFLTTVRMAQPFILRKKVTLIHIDKSLPREYGEPRYPCFTSVRSRTRTHERMDLCTLSQVPPESLYFLGLEK